MGIIFFLELVPAVNCLPQRNAAEAESCRTHTADTFLEDSVAPALNRLSGVGPAQRLDVLPPPPGWPEKMPPPPPDWRPPSPPFQHTVVDLPPPPPPIPFFPPPALPVHRGDPCITAGPARTKSMPTASDMEKARIRKLLLRASDHFQHHTTVNAGHASNQALRERRTTLQNLHRNNAELRRHAVRCETHHQRPLTPPPGSAKVNMKLLKGHLPAFVDRPPTVAWGRDHSAANALRDARAAMSQPAACGSEMLVHNDAGAADYLRGIEDLYRRMRATYSEIQRHPDAVLRSRTPPINHSFLGEKNKVHRGVPPQLVLPLKPSEPSTEAMRLREELDKLEARWQHLSGGHGDESRTSFHRS